MPFPQHDGRFHADGHVSNNHVATDAAIAVSKLAAGTNGYVLATDDGVPTWVEPSSGSPVFIAETPTGIKDGENDEFGLSVAASPNWGILFVESIALRIGIDFEIDDQDGTVVRFLTTQLPGATDDLFYVGVGA